MPKTNSNKNIVGWNEIDWRTVESTVFKLQRRIYQASVSGNVHKIRKLQKTLLRSYSAKLLSVRRVTQDNQGRKTAGVDGIKSLSPEERFDLVSQLTVRGKSKPVRRVYIPKTNGEKRPLGIPVMQDRAKQNLVKMVLEPEWEARFESESYGFRPGRSCHDAIEAIFNAIRYKPKYVLDADIAKCFDRINHEALLKKLNTFPTLRKQIRAWLKAGVVEGDKLFPTTEGTPQGGVCSPLLANIALHGIENQIRDYYKSLIGVNKSNERSLAFVRYADDFVLMHENLSVVKQCQKVIEQFLSNMGLELKPSKTRICHTLYKYEDNPAGFNFLGFEIKQRKVGKYQTNSLRGKPLGFKTLIQPEAKKVKEHYEKIAEIIESFKAKSQADLIGKLNPIIIGWANYYSSACSKISYRKLDNLIFIKLRGWAMFRHPNKNKFWIMDKYWKSIGNRKWCFATKAKENALILRLYSNTPIARFTKVKGNKTPYDGDWIYWSTRMGKHPEAPTAISRLLKRQKGKCNHCGLNFKDEDIMEIDHITPKSKGGKNNFDNLQILHRHCHDTKTSLDGSLRR
jgi:RNA-directed DNA polymerase